MPPKKRQRLASTASHPSTPTPSLTTNTSAASPQPQHSAAPAASKLSISTSTSTNDWTPAEETALFKAIIRYKPTGIHKHMHMISVASAVRAQAPHISVARIWAKLHTLYDLSALDEREDNYAASLARQEAEAGGEPEEVEFALPADEDEDLERMMWNRRFKTKDDDEEGSSSPPMFPMLSQRRGKEASEEAAPTPVPAPKTGTGRRPGRPSRKSAVEQVVKEEEDDDEGSVDVDEDEDEEDGKGSTPARATRRSGRRK